MICRLHLAREAPEIAPLLLWEAFLQWSIGLLLALRSGVMDIFFLFYPSTRIDMSICLEGVGFEGLLDIVVYVQPFLSLLRFRMLLSCPDF